MSGSYEHNKISLQFFGEFSTKIIDSYFGGDIGKALVDFRLVRLNKKLQYETGKLLSEKRGKRWALSRFAFEVYDASLADDPAASDSSVAELSEEENL